ncbi:MAG: glycosyltransferase family 39 protein [Candidatus Gottesmanbacteria bacterium]|nr:glycosyltransferase family 39 protein [Candidatus Gottesmanbacteria bacterium]
MNLGLLKNHKIFIIVVLLASLLRFLYLDKIPTAVGGDELHYILTAKSVFLTGYDTSGTWNPLSVFLFRYPPGEQLVAAELPYFLHIPFSGPFSLSLFTAKLPFALLSVGIVVLLYLIAKELFGSLVGEATGLVAAINPWFIVLGRTAYEATPSIFFYLLALYMLLRARKWTIFFCLVPLLLAFYSYIATKLIFLPFVAIASFLAYHKQNHKYRLHYVALCLISIGIVLAYILVLKTSSNGSRLGELFLPNSPTVISQVNDTRKNAMQSPLLTLTVNKYTVYIQLITGKLFRIFSPSYLFIEGDQIFLAGQSFFYGIDFIFMVVGGLALYAKKRLYFILLSLFVLFGSFPHLFHQTSGDYSLHLALMFPFLTLFIGIGISELINSVPKKFKNIGIAICFLIYTASVVIFLSKYFLQIPLYGKGDFPMRTLSRYLTLSKKQLLPITLYSIVGGDTLEKYLFYTNDITKNTIPILKHLNTTRSFEFNGIQFAACDTNIKTTPQNTVIISDYRCNMHLEEPNIQLSRLDDGGTLYKIFNDTVCGSYALKRYPGGIQIKDFNIERLDEERFCQTYITRY